MESTLRRAQEVARAEAALAIAEADLADAEASLVKAVLEQSRSGADPVEANAAVDRARACCRQAYTTLTRLKLQDPSAASGEKTRMPVEEPADNSAPGTAAPTPSTQSGAPPAVGAQEPPRKQSRLEREYHRLIGGSSGEEASAPASPDFRVLARQSFMLLALVLAYLQYYFLDVNLQIARLPSLVLG